MPTSPSDPARFALAVSFTNHGNLTCTTFGFPGARLVEATGASYDLPRRAQTRLTTVYLPPGGTASALLTYLRPGAGALTGPTSPGGSAAGLVGSAFTPVYLLVTPPDDRTPVRLAWTAGPIVDQRADAWPTTSIGPVVP
jgi:hypothetical protein